MDQTERRKFLGSSDAAAVLGLSRWTTPLELWAKKTGEVEYPDDPSLAKTLGVRLEEVVAELFTEKTGLKVRRVNTPRVHPDYPFLSAQIDREVVGDDSILECKTANSFKTKEWAEDEIPQEYIVQVNHQLAVTGKRKAYIACLIGNHQFVSKVIERDEALLKSLVEKEVEFWTKYVVPKVMPGIITARDSDVLNRLFPDAQPGNLLDLGDEITRLIEQRNASIQDVKIVEENIDRIENQIKAALRENEAGVAGKFLIQWKNQVQSRLDQARLKTEQPDLYGKFQTEVKFRKLSIREVKRG